MKAMVFSPGEGELTLKLADIDRPRLGSGDVRIAVRAASVNRADVLMRKGLHTVVGDGSRPAVAGLDAAGEVIEIGSAVVGIRVGLRVMTMVSGGLAEEVVVPAGFAIPIPAEWSYAAGAAAVLGLMTAHNALVTAGKFVPGEVVLIHAAASGVGTQGVQLARLLGAKTVIGTSRAEREIARLQALGLDELVVVQRTEFAEQVLAITSGHGADVLIDHVGGPYLAENVKAAALRGRIVDVGRLGGAEGVLDLEEVARKRLEIIGTTFRTRTVEEKIAVVTALCHGIDLEAVADRIHPTIEETFDWTDVLVAQQAVQRNSHIGKFVLTVGSGDV